MKTSLKKRLGVTFIGLIAVTLVSIGVINSLFLEDFYIKKKTESIEEVYRELKNIDVRTNPVRVTQEFKNFYSEKNISWLISTPQSTIVTSGSRDDKMENARLFGYVESLNKSPTEVIKETETCVLQKIRDDYLNTDYLDMWGVLDNGNYFLIRTPLSSIRDSVEISNIFFIYVGGLAILVSAVVIWIFTRKLTRPITELTEISKRMTDLDFDVKYTSGGEDEIGILGENFNKMSNELEHAIAELKSANNELKKDIENKIQVDEMRKEFLSNVSHELKTPIALIQGYAEGLKECINDDAQSREFYCDVIMDESGKMNQMVKKLLTLNQLEFGKDQVVMERFDIVDLIQGVVQATQILAEQKNAEIIFTETSPVYVWGDEFKMEEVVTNYVSNALNHVKYDNKVEIRILHKEGRVRITVFNTGDPIPEEDIDNIWIKFYKVDKARTREYGGSGIGLSIVKAIMDSMNQQCGVKNYENGVEFWFELESK